MKVASINNEMTLVHLKRSELVLLNNALNEVCHGVKIPAFSTRLGYTREEAKKLLGKISALINLIDDEKQVIGVQSISYVFDDEEIPVTSTGIR